MSEFNIQKTSSQRLFDTQNEQTPGKKEKKSYKKLFIFLGLGILFIVGIIILLIFLLKGNEKDKEEIKCDPGYFLVVDKEPIKENCQKCSLENCEICHGTKLNNECTSCGDEFFPIYENNTIKVCEPKCKTGKDDQCGLCNPDTNKCEGCNP